MSVRSSPTRSSTTRTTSASPPVIPGYFGTVPTDFAQRNPGANVVAQGTWSGYERPSWLDPTSTLFDKVAADYYSISSQLIGDAGAYKMDPLHEGGKSGNISVSGAATGIEKALRLAHPNAIWVLLGWQSDPSTTLLSGIKDKSRILIVDGLADTRTTLDDESRWPGFPYAFGTIYNFGGNTSIGALTTVWLDRYFAARAKAGSALQGISILPEGFYNNPAAFELMSELPWMDKAPDQTQWFHDYALGRYGTNAAADAWTTIADTVYSMDPIGTHSESQDSLFDAQPSLTTTKARSCCSVGQVRYDFPTFATALPKLISASPSVVQHAAYDYDLTDVTRQVIANTSRDLLPKINTAYQAGDVDEFDSLTASWIALMKQQDAVLATNSDFLLGTYDDHAAAQNGDVGVYDLQNLLTTWGTKASFSLHDYANREWQGLVGDLYVSRWQQYFASLRTAMVKGGSPASIDWYSVDEAWAKADHHYADKPSGDIVVEAGKAVKMLDQGTVSLSLSASTIRPGSAGTVTATVQNTSPLGDVDTVDVSLATPDGLSATATSDTKLTDIAAGEKRTVTWNVTADPDQVAGVVSTLTATAQVNAGGEEDTKTATSTVLVGTEPAAPWKTYTTETSPTFAQAGGQIGIETTGNDFSKTTRRFSAVYQQSTMSVGETAIVHVDVQDSQATRPYARSGIAVSSDMTAADSPMVLLSLTPLNGCVLTWNGTSSGSLDTHLYARELSGPMWLRLTRTADGFEGACSTDGESWTTLGTAKPAGMSDEPDAGLLASAVNSGGTDAVLAAFSQWSVRDGQEGDLKLSSSTVKAGTDVQATGSTFPSSANVTLSLRGQDDDATPIALGTATTDRDGGFTSSLSIPDSVVAGDYTVVASGAGVTATAPLKVTAADKPSATVTVSPSAVSAAQLADPGVVVTGANFPSNGDVALSIDGAAAGSEPAAADGSVTIPFRSTSLRAGTHTVRLSAGNVSAEAQLVVLPDPVVTLSTSSVKAGGVVTVTGEHFPASVTATIELHSDPVTLSKLSTDSNGSFSVSVTVPKDAPTGKHEIVVTAGTITAEAAITVTDGGAGAGTNPGSGTGGTKHDSDGGLASTGVDFPFWLLLAGIGLMLLGGSAFVVRRRRNG
ncbi:alpha-N-acetylglucosaminidase C-terminal domain-containing protein [Humibacter ginsenosidimutans]|uniref:alpha-N-acetylglucosaminidase C-terminal domain-containing protein n=1 Tax=Humibacter ginsenosidimutans TaxID=2599293 RepID=UPI0020C80D2B|nr:alpha-N-acetylglucosaminidase C-terminal domain-containing protein [Humibacter ginsenosidimutans]